MSRTLYWYDDGDDGSSESWGESPEAYLRRKWLESHNYLVPVTTDYEAAYLYYFDHQSDNEAVETIRNEIIHGIVDAALGEEA